MDFEWLGRPAGGWRLVANGGANAVLSAPDEPRLQGKLARVRIVKLKKKKKRKMVVTVEGGGERGAGRNEEGKQPERKTALVPTEARCSVAVQHGFGNGVMARLLGVELGDPGVLVPTTRATLEAVQANLTQGGGDDACGDSVQIDLTADAVVLVVDRRFECSGGGSTSSSSKSVICVEIKPKAGFAAVLDNSNSSNAASGALEGRTGKGEHPHVYCKVCRFCLHQTEKVQSGKWTAPSKYVCG